MDCLLPLRARRQVPKFIPDVKGVAGRRGKTGDQRQDISPPQGESSTKGVGGVAQKEILDESIKADPWN